MRIGIVSRAENVSGKEIMTLELGKGLKGAGHDLLFVSSIWNNGDYGRRLAHQGFTVINLPLGAISATMRSRPFKQTIEQLLHLPSLWGHYRHLLREWNPSRLIHTSWHHLLVLWPYLSPTRDWYWVHEVLPDLPHYKAVFGTLGKRLAGFIAVSHAVSQSLRSLGIPESQITVIYNGIGDFAQLPIHSPEVAREFRLGIVGQVVPWKGHHDLLKAFSLILPKQSNSSLHIFGNGNSEYQEMLQEMATKLGISHQVFWHGFVEDRKAIYDQIDICIVPIPFGANEALPTVAIEAGMCGIPVVGCDRGGLPEIVQDNITGKLVSPGDIEGLAAAVLQIMNSPTLRASYGSAAYKTTMARFNRERFIAAFEAHMQQRST
jgi:glycosyltransferase involved in cell wall biosynthesis